MILLRCLLSPTWRRIGCPLIKPMIRHESSTSAFANIQKTLSHNLLVFEYKDRVLPLVGAIGFIQFIALDVIAYWSFYLFGTVTAKEANLTSDSSLLERAATIVPTKRFRYTTNLLIVLLSKFLPFFCLYSLLSRWCYICCLYYLSSEMCPTSLSSQGWFVDWSCYIWILA